MISATAVMQCLVYRCKYSNTQNYSGVHDIGRMGHSQKLFIHIQIAGNYAVVRADTVATGEVN